MRIFRIILLSALASATALVGRSAGAGRENIFDGYPVANFALTVNAAENGELYGRTLRNPGKLGDWLQDEGAVRVEVEKNGARHPLSGFAKKSVARAFPFVRNSYSKSPVTAANMEIETFCPLAVNDALTSSLPVLMLEMKFKNPGSRLEEFSIVITPDSLFSDGATFDTAGLTGVADARCRLT
ncbi:MAG: hypothetical protein LBH06_09210, partial [Rikenellaceae bacterium]|nr:hypothetical protein [Rikenellaceae bacterium]